MKQIAGNGRVSGILLPENLRNGGYQSRPQSRAGVDGRIFAAPAHENLPCLLVYGCGSRAGLPGKPLTVGFRIV